MRVTSSETFIGAAKKLPPDRKKKIASTVGNFISETKLPSLDFRPLKGTDRYYIIDSTGGDRIILRKIDDDHYEAVDCGTHDIYRRWNR